ncbi:MAG: hypothetical protein ACE5R6_21400 [Candidatus Heimdallarchaeota archaeon]
MFSTIMFMRRRISERVFVVLLVINRLEYLDRLIEHVDPELAEQMSRGNPFKEGLILG